MSFTTGAKTKFFKLHKLPLVLEANAFYYIFGGDYAEGYVTDKFGKAKPIGSVDMINTLIDAKLVGQLTPKNLTSYRSDYDTLYVYSGYLIDSVSIVKRCKDSIDEYGIGTGNLEVDWNNRLTLTYI